MSEVTVQMTPTGGEGRPVEKRVEVPKPKPLVLQVLAGLVLVGLTAALIVLLMDDPSTGATFVIAVCLLMCVFALVVWASAVLQLGIGPTQLFKLIKMVLSALKEVKDNEQRTPQPTPGQPGQPGVPGGGPAPY